MIIILPTLGALAIWLIALAVISPVLPATSDHPEPDYFEVGENEEDNDNESF